MTRKTQVPVPGVEGNLLVNKGELQYRYYGYSIAVMSALLLALTHVSNLVVTPVCIERRAYRIPYVGINAPSPADSGRNGGGDRGPAAEARQA